MIIRKGDYNFAVDIHLRFLSPNVLPVWASYVENAVGNIRFHQVNTTDPSVFEGNAGFCLLVKRFYRERILLEFNG